MNDADFNEAVTDYLRESGDFDVAKRSAAMDANGRAMSSADVAREMDLALTADTVVAVAEARRYWVREVEAEA